MRNSVLSTDVYVEDGAVVESSVLMPGVRVGKGAIVRHAILDKNVYVSDGAAVGTHRADDERRGFTISADGVVVVGKGELVE